MTKQASRSALFISTAANYIKNVLNFITPAFHVQSQEDMYDTLANEYATVATKSALSALVLGTNFKELDYRFVTNDESEQGLLSLYQYIKNTSATYSWQLIRTIGVESKMVSVANTTLFDALVLDTDYFKGWYAEIIDNDYGQTEVKRYMRNDSDVWAWRTISKYTSVTLG